ncbi:hypothetical protein [Mesorhizobium sp. CAU 1741]|uniref:hypothetical protein n=1 Tax=Mesorhizobium sp. CAU 1741 TaxID=3140366 RepID=UPI00325B5E8B
MYRVPARGLSSMLILSASALGPSHASSFIDVGAPESTPSIVMMGEAVAEAIEAQPVSAQKEPSEDERFALSASVTAIGADAIPKTKEDVASVTPAEASEPERQAPSWTSDALPTLMRGGIVAEALPRDTSDE